MKGDEDAAAEDFGEAREEGSNIRASAQRAAASLPRFRSGRRASLVPESCSVPPVSQLIPAG